LEAGSPAPKLPEEFHGIKERPRSILSIFPALVYFLMDFGNLQKTIYIVPIHIGHSARSNPLNIKSPLISNVEFIKLYMLSITLPP